LLTPAHTSQGKKLNAQQAQEVATMRQALVAFLNTEWVRTWLLSEHCITQHRAHHPFTTQCVDKTFFTDAFTRPTHPYSTLSRSLACTQTGLKTHNA
jgi:hypothetical protein